MAEVATRRAERLWHETHAAKTDEWLTPRPILDALGAFDLDPCHGVDPPPWPTATRMLSSGGLSSAWQGRVWLNPPYGRESIRWLARLAEHGDGVALIFARTDTAWFAEHVWLRASAVRFLVGRIYFCRPDGRRAACSAPAPSVLVAYGAANADALERCGLPGAFMRGPW